ncbi:MAG: D-sedoheptulose 7-phosphate isomerase [Actinomycetota bacterium]
MSDVKNKETTIRRILEEGIGIQQSMIDGQMSVIAGIADMIASALREGGKVLLFGNGGSAADSQHLAAEFVNRFRFDRAGLPAVALTTDTSILTAIGNDSGFENVFARQVELWAKPGDVVVAISTSGASPNILKGIVAAKEHDAGIVCLTGEGGRELTDLADICFVVPSADTARIQEAHITVGHIVCHLVEEEIFGSDK